MPNRLAQESSPYLLQHANNPVDWYPWGPEALERAKSEEKPIFLSIGYSACHWCHVMEHESFEHPEIAALLNERFICVKVDREERPDLDHIYMQAVQAISGRGGWPMSVFLTPEREPFFGGTYWPPHARMGMPGFDQVLRAVDDAWKNRREMAREQAGALAQQIRDLGAHQGDPGAIGEKLLKSAAFSLEKIFDHREGGFGGAPKFPHPMDLRVLFRVARRAGGKGPALEMARLTLDKMAAGGIYDHLAGGFHRYSVDARWLVPHFEKMLYDNALLASCYAEAFQVTGNAEYARIVSETCDYITREMTHPEGGFFSTQDADTEGEEGLTYVWTPAEIEHALGADAAAIFCKVFDVSVDGNFEGRNILHLARSIETWAATLNVPVADLKAQLSEAKRTLLAARNQRPQPGLDDKVLLNWNALMIEALCDAASALGEDRFAVAAGRAADFILAKMRRADGRYFHSWRKGVASGSAFLDDYAYFAQALISLYEVTGDERWIEHAQSTASDMLTWFEDPAGGSLFFTASDHEELLTRFKDVHDSSVPCGNAMAATALVRLAKIVDDARYVETAERILKQAVPIMERSPSASGQMLLAADLAIGPFTQLVFTGTDELIGRFARKALAWHWPGKIVARRSENSAKAPALDALFANREIDSTPRLYVCRDYACEAPAVGEEAIEASLAQHRAPPSS